MSGPDRERPSPSVDDPDGWHWSAIPPDGWVEPTEPDYAVDGDALRFMWDYGVVVPLWLSGGRVPGGLVPDEPEWLRRALGLSKDLISELTAWGNAMDHLDASPRLRTDEAYAELDRQARLLVERLQAEVGDRFTVTYQPW